MSLRLPFSLASCFLLSGVASDSSLLYFLTPPFFSTFFYLLLPSFFPSLFFIFLLSSGSPCLFFFFFFPISTSSPPQLFLLEGPQGRPRERGVGGVLFFSVCSSRSVFCRGRARVGCLSRAVGLGLVCLRADKASVTITTGWRRPCVPVSNSSLGDQIRGYSQRFWVPTVRARRPSPASLGA